MVSGIVETIRQGGVRVMAWGTAAGNKRTDRSDRARVADEMPASAMGTVTVLRHRGVGYIERDGGAGRADLFFDRAAVEADGFDGCKKGNASASTRSRIPAAATARGRSTSGWPARTPPRHRRRPTAPRDDGAHFGRSARPDPPPRRIVSVAHQGGPRSVDIARRAPMPSLRALMTAGAVVLLVVVYFVAG